MRDKMGYWVLPYVDDFLVDRSSSGIVNEKENYSREIVALGRSFQRLGVVIHTLNGCWEILQQIDHLGVQLDTM